jgi:imidazolonepropionase-like amidohydrolase
MSAILFKNASILDGRADEALADHHVLVENGEIRELSDRPITAASARTVDLGGKTLMPGLIDCHVHVIATTANLGANA